jgi:AcrR family transcriptional regulator
MTEPTSPPAAEPATEPATEAAEATEADPPVATEPIVGKLPRGRHRLSREQVEQSQRHRLMLGMAEAMTEKGFVGTSVADVLKRSGVGRETFYQYYGSKLDCFMDAFDTAGEVLFGRVNQAQAELQGTPVERFEQGLTAYLDLLAEQPALARLFLVEVYAAGPEAIGRRAALQARIVEAVAELLEASTPRARFGCEVVVAAIATMVTNPLVTGDLAGLGALRERIVDLVRATIVRD